MGLADPVFSIPRWHPTKNMVFTIGVTCHMFASWSTSMYTGDVDFSVWFNLHHLRTPSQDFELEFVEVIQRHHKRTPYTSNTFFKEDVSWNCIGSGPVVGLARSVDVLWIRPSGDLKTYCSSQVNITEVQVRSTYDIDNPLISMFVPSSGRHPFLRQIHSQHSLVRGFRVARMQYRSFRRLILTFTRCQFPAITAEGLVDSFTHGSVGIFIRWSFADFYTLYRIYVRYMRIALTWMINSIQKQHSLVSLFFPSSSAYEFTSEPRGNQ